jgi:dUTP pyrophosphatase
MNITLKENDLLFAKVKPNAIIPTKNEEDAGMDIYCCFDEDYIIIPAHSTKLIPTGIASAMSNKYYLQVQERGSTGSKGIKYGAGVLDASYRGEIFMCINNVNDRPIVISKLPYEDLIDKYGDEDEDGDIDIPYNPSEPDNDRFYIWLDDNCRAIMYPYEKAIGQLVVLEVPKMNVQEVTYEELLQIPSKRGTGKLGSSNK